MNNQEQEKNNYSQLEIEALNGRLIELKNVELDLERDISFYNNGSKKGRKSLTSLKIELEKVKEQIRILEKRVDEAKNHDSEDVLTSASLRMLDNKYEKIVDKYEEYESNIASQRKVIEGMKDGMIKRRATKKVEKLEAKLEKLATKGAKIRDKQRYKIAKKNSLRKLRERTKIKLRAKATVYGNYAVDAKNALTMEGLSFIDKMKYKRQAKKYSRKFKRAYKKFKRMDMIDRLNGNTTIKSANPTEIAKKVVQRIKVVYPDQQKKHP